MLAYSAAEQGAMKIALVNGDFYAVTGSTLCAVETGPPA